ncbi:MAG: DoxX family protein [Muribaculaceae bacterium]|nr:DoxX family protein [Muribaculaceae bacterium]
MSLIEIFKQLYFKIKGYSYTNLGRLFMRLFVGIMMIQFGVRQIMVFNEVAPLFPSVLGLSSQTSLIVMICIELGCSLFVMCGFLTRLMVLPLFVAMMMAEYNILCNMVIPAIFPWTSPAFVPIMFLGIYFFILLVGPGKISVDYFLSLYLLHSADKNEDELEEV